MHFAIWKSEPRISSSFTLAWILKNMHIILFYCGQHAIYERYRYMYNALSPKASIETKHVVPPVFKHLQFEICVCLLIWYEIVHYCFSDVVS